MSAGVTFAAKRQKSKTRDRLMELVREINQLLEEKEHRLKREKADEKKGFAAEG